jgi:hypothetical protein
MKMTKMPTAAWRPKTNRNNENREWIDTDIEERRNFVEVMRAEKTIQDARTPQRRVADGSDRSLAPR